MHLMEKANVVAWHKGLCDTELSTNEQTSGKRIEVWKRPHAEIDEWQASTAMWTEEIFKLSKAIAELDVVESKAFR